MDVPDPPVSLAARPTPVERLETLSEAHDADLYVKRDDRTAGVAQGNKIRKLEYLLGDALAAGADVVVTGGGVQSNHCRATAVLGRRLGLDVHLVLLGEDPGVPDGNLLLDRIVGAEVAFVDPATVADGWGDALSAVADRLSNRGRAPFVVPIGGSNARGALGYARAFEELHDWQERADVSVDRIFVPAGSYGTLAGLTAGSVVHEGPRIVGVEVTGDDRDLVRRRVRALVEGVLEACGEETQQRDRIDDAFAVRSAVGPGYAEPSGADCLTITEVGRREGLVLDPVYTAPAFRVFSEAIEREETALFVHTGGSYGLFPHRASFAEVL